MEYTFQFGEVLADFPELLSGAALTLYLSIAAMAIGLGVGTLGALALDTGGRIAVAIVRVYVEAIRNTPFLVQLFMVFFGLPVLGIGLDGNQAALVAMSLNLGAYATEIIRAGVASVGHGQIEAARALGLRPLQIFHRIVLFQALRAVYPPLCSQFVLIMLASSVVSAVAAEELSGVANSIQARTFRSFEIYIIVTGMYLAMTLMVQAVLGVIGWLAFAGRGR